MIVILNKNIKWPFIAGRKQFIKIWYCQALVSYMSKMHAYLLYYTSPVASYFSYFSLKIVVFFAHLCDKSSRQNQIRGVTSADEYTDSSQLALS